MGARFLQNRRFRKTYQKSSILASFSEVKTTKNREKNALKNMFFFERRFLSFFFEFLRFGLNFGRPKIIKKSKKSHKNRKKIDFVMGSVLKEASGRVLGRFWESFGRVLGGFGQDF